MGFNRSAMIEGFSHSFAYDRSEYDTQAAPTQPRPAAPQRRQAIDRLASTPSARSPSTRCRRRNPAMPARRWAWRRSPTRCGRIFCATTRPIRYGRTATASCCPPAMPRCCSTRCCILPACGARTAASITETPAVSLDDIKNFRQLDSVTPGHPEYGRTTGVETTTGPLGQGCGNSVGMAIASRWLGARYNRPDFTLFDFDVYTICSDGDLMEGVASEAASLAGHLAAVESVLDLRQQHRDHRGPHRSRLQRGRREPLQGLSLERAARARRQRHGRRSARALEIFRRTDDRPTLIIVDSIIGYGAPHKQNTAAAHSDPLGEEEARLDQALLRLAGRCAISGAGRRL